MSSVSNCKIDADFQFGKVCSTSSIIRVRSIIMSLLYHIEEGKNKI